VGLFRRGPKKPGQREVWRDTAGRLGGEYFEGGKRKAPRIRLVHGPWRLTLDSYTVSNGQSSVTYTRLQAPYVSTGEVVFRTYKANFFHRIGRTLGMQDIPIRNRVFDEEFVVRGNHERRIQELFSGSKLPDLLRRYPALRLDVKAPTRKVRKKHGDRLFNVVVVTVGVVKDSELIGAMFAVGMSTLERLAAVLQASEEEPPELFENAPPR
jgi:hypothetical protein